MKKYKFVGNKYGYNFVKNDTTYDEDFHPWQYSPELTVKDAVKLYPRDWELVKGFVLPEKWCVNRKGEPSIQEWFNKNNTNTNNKDYSNEMIGWYTHFPKYPPNSSHTSDEVHPGYTLITPDEFKQYVLKETNMKIIKGYKLNGVVDARTAAYSLGCSSVISSDGLFLNECTQRAIVKAKEIKVLDIWFDVVYEDEYKVGEFVIVEGYSKNFDGQPLEIKGITEYSGMKYYYFVGVNDKIFKHTQIKRKATVEEINQYKLPRINGYEGTFDIFGQTVTYGCAIISTAGLKRLREWNHHLNGNRQIKKITLDSGVDITMEKINQILKYVENLW